MRIGIMGGTFNPPHIGHINAARAAREALSLERLIFIPAGIPPHKEMAQISAGSEDRLQMSRLAAKIVSAEVSDMEIRRAGKSFTIDTLRELKRQNPSDELWLIMGTDMLLSLETWREPENIFKEASIAAVPRNDADVKAMREHRKVLKEKYAAKIEIIETEAISISSTQLRPSDEKEELLKFLPEEIYDYIKEHKLYGFSGSDVV